MPKFRKRPVVIEATRWEGGALSVLDKFCGLNWSRADVRDVHWTPEDDKEQVVVWNAADSQWLCVPVGFWIIRGVKGELYPCEPDIFAATYEPAE